MCHEHDCDFCFSNEITPRMRILAPGDGEPYVERHRWEMSAYVLKVYMWEKVSKVICEGVKIPRGWSTSEL